ncbi:MAG: DUF4339 domain-containing protein [Planctomycetaceae bacterium]|nr:DUF4339 domain-containing protein [Planctomycetaceae bacterium]
MGIRFFCPNGHKLNVKEELAGKRGICPHCGVRMDIPLVSTRESRHPATEQTALQKEQTGQNSGQSNTFPSPDTGSSRLFPTEEPSSEPTENHVQNSLQENMLPNAKPKTETDTGNSLPQTPLEDMTVVWYVQTANGQRFGPAIGPILKTWIEERRVGPTMLVWREGWPEWLPAKNVFPEVLQIFKPKSQEHFTASDAAVREKPLSPQTADPMEDLLTGLSGETASTGLTLRPKKKPVANLGLIVVFLTIMLVMIAVLIFVLIWKTRSKPPKKPEIRVNVTFSAPNPHDMNSVA